MATTVKVIHILKRVEFLDSNIQELRALEKQLNPTRPYYEAMKIAIEQQINHLLNERVKLMELKIENPLPHLVEDVVSHQVQLKQSPMYDFEALGQSSHSLSFTKSPLVKELRESLPEKRASLPPRANLLRDLPPVEY